MRLGGRNRTGVKDENQRGHVRARSAHSRKRAVTVSP